MATVIDRWYTDMVQARSQGGSHCSTLQPNYRQRMFVYSLRSRAHIRRIRGVLNYQHMHIPNCWTMAMRRAGCLCAELLHVINEHGGAKRMNNQHKHNLAAPDSWRCVPPAIIMPSGKETRTIAQDG